ncbi:hypothetical protein B0H17DRAFT_1221573 [Mycena rosella]|uniref:Uncharacterized protein n=1 Tax=Mycena rosella TaxID=1033263 RepID=A0AAD7B1G4_MYCRO|nr:hypothetical protein B0H17DRAFT_1221573 [Mycena rosella]
MITLDDFTAPKSVSKDKNPKKEKAAGDTLNASEKKENLQASEQKKPSAKNTKKKDKKHDPEYQLEPHKYGTRRSTKSRCLSRFPPFRVIIRVSKVFISLPATPTTILKPSTNINIDISRQGFQHKDGTATSSPAKMVQMGGKSREVAGLKNGCYRWISSAVFSVHDSELAAPQSCPSSASPHVLLDRIRFRTRFVTAPSSRNGRVVRLDAPAHTIGRTAPPRRGFETFVDDGACAASWQSDDSRGDWVHSRLPRAHENTPALSAPVAPALSSDI